MFEALDISGSALLAQRVRMDTIAGNLANMNTTHDAAGRANPYRRRFVVLAPGQPGERGGAGVHVQAVEQDQGAFRKVLQPWHPDHDAQGYVKYPNIDMTTEMVNAMEDPEWANESNQFNSPSHPIWWTWYSWPTWWTHFNGITRIKWTKDLTPAKETTLTYQWHYYWR